MIAIIVLAAFILTLALLLPSLFVRLPSPEELKEIQEAKERISLKTERLKLRNDVRTTLLQVVTALVLILGAYFTWNQVQDNQKALSANLRNSGEQLRLAQQTQVTQSFNKAIDQLGSRQMEIRMGSLYALGSIAESSDLQQRRNIAEIFSAYIRIHSPWPPPKGSTYGATDPPSNFPVMGNLGEQATTNWIVLRRVDLRGADLRDLHLKGADLRESHLGAADLRGVYLEQSDLRGVRAYPTAAIDKTTHLTGAWQDKDTRWPEGADMSKFGLRTCRPGIKVELAPVYC
jgi:hypothetical protein